MSRYRAVLFDLDGTLIDSIGLILASYHHTLAAHGFPPVTDAEWLAGVGTPLRVQLARFAPTPEAMDRMVQTYRTYNLGHHDALVRAYEGVPALVRRIRAAGYRTAVVTSKNVEGTRRGLAVAGLEAEIEVLVCADTVTHPKPHPEPVLQAMERLGTGPAETLFIGDSIHDLNSGRAAGARTGAVLWGPFDRAALEPGQPDHWLERPDDLATLLFPD
jgi:pyrophosphatase PpaX